MSRNSGTLTETVRCRTVAYADDGYIKGKLSVTLQVLVEINHVFKEDASLELNISKTAILHKTFTQ